jgi:hypothetical protein
MAGLPDTAAQFVRAYYSDLVYSPNELCMFYDQERAILWRDSLGDGAAVPFAPDLLVPEIRRGSQVGILKFTVLPQEQAFSVVVYGSIVFAATSKMFHQFFALVEIDARFFVVTDYLTFQRPQEAAGIEIDGLVLLPRDAPQPEPQLQNQQQQRGAGAAPSAWRPRQTRRRQQGTSQKFSFRPPS